MTPKISVIVPVYNTDKYLRRCVDSILAQTFTDFELLLIDDGSKDSSGAICDEYAVKDERVRVFHKPNGGVSSARNLGLDNARGEWIAFVDSDDFTYPCWLDNFSINNCIEYDILCQGFETDNDILKLHDVKGIRKFGLIYEGDISQFLTKIYQNHFLGYPWIKLFKHKIITDNDLKFNSKITLREDELFLLQYARYCKKVKSTDKVGYFYFAPQWEKKYIVSDNEIETLCLEALNALYKLSPEPQDNALKYEYRESLTRLYLERFKYGNHSERISTIKKLRALIKLYYSDSKLFYLTKKTISTDKSYYISYAVLLLHLIAKRYQRR